MAVQLEVVMLEVELFVDSRRDLEVHRVLEVVVPDSAVTEEAVIMIEVEQFEVPVALVIGVSLFEFEVLEVEVFDFAEQEAE